VDRWLRRGVFLFSQRRVIFLASCAREIKQQLLWVTTDKSLCVMLGIDLYILIPPFTDTVKEKSQVLFAFLNETLLSSSLHILM